MLEFLEGGNESSNTCRWPGNTVFALNKNKPQGDASPS